MMAWGRAARVTFKYFCSLSVLCVLLVYVVLCVLLINNYILYLSAATRRGINVFIVITPGLKMICIFLEFLLDTDLDV